MEALLDFSKPFDPSLLDQIINVFYTPRHPEVGGDSIGIISSSKRKLVKCCMTLRRKSVHGPSQTVLLSSVKTLAACSMDSS